MSGKELLGELELVGALGRISSSLKAAELVDLLAVDFAASLARVLAATEAPVVPAVRALVAGADSNPSG